MRPWPVALCLSLACLLFQALPAYAFERTVQIRHADERGNMALSADVPVTVIDHGNGLCTYRLEYNASSGAPTPQGILQIDSKLTNVLPSFTQPCGDAPPGFVDTQHDVIMQQNLYYWTYKARKYIEEHAFRKVPTQISTGKAIYTTPLWVFPVPNNPGECKWAGPGVEACYEWFNPNLFEFWDGKPRIAFKDRSRTLCPAAACASGDSCDGGVCSPSKLTRPGLVFHEYAHYMTGVYGIYGPHLIPHGHCDSPRVQTHVLETVADMAQFVMERHYFSRDYFDTARPYTPHDPSSQTPHDSSAPYGRQFEPGIPGCLSAGYSTYSQGKPLEWALKEVLHDTDCNAMRIDPATGGAVSVSNCAGTITRGAIGWRDDADANSSMMTALAYALSIAPSLQFEAVAAGMVEWLRLYRDPAIARNVEKVFAHHGVLGRAPLGAVDRISALAVDGWACDPDTPGKGVRLTDIELKWFRDGGWRSERLADVTASLSSRSAPGVTVACEGGAAHGFSVPIGHVAGAWRAEGFFLVMPVYFRGAVMNTENWSAHELGAGISRQGFSDPGVVEGRGMVINAAAVAAALY